MGISLFVKQVIYLSLKPALNTNAQRCLSFAISVIYIGPSLDKGCGHSEIRIENKIQKQRNIVVILLI